MASSRLEECQRRQGEGQRRLEGRRRRWAAVERRGAVGGALSAQREVKEAVIEAHACLLLHVDFVDVPHDRLPAERYLQREHGRGGQAG